MPPLRLEVFAAQSNDDGTTVVTDLSAMEEARLASYEQGYTAGWEDAVKAQTTEKNQMAADLSHNLQSLSFTYHEARVHILRAIEPLFTEMMAHVLPDIGRGALTDAVQKAVMPLAEIASDTPIKILFNPAARAFIEPVIKHANAPPLELIEETTLGEGQVFLQLGDCETRIDLDGALAEMKSAIEDFFTLTTKDNPHG